MNYFELHIGDYAEAAGHLSCLEDGIYGRLIRKYYATENPLPKEISAVQRLVVAKKKVERIATEKVLREFFELREDGWHNARCDEEIAKFLAGEPEREARKANETARIQRFRDERARLFDDLARAGQHPAWNLPMATIRALHERFCNAPVTPPATAPVTLLATAPVTPATATHSPFPIPQDPLPILSEERQPPKQKRANGNGHAKVEIPSDFTITDSMREQCLKRYPDADIEEMFVQFRAHHESHGKAMKSWTAAWTTWLGNAAKFGYPKRRTTERKWD